MKERKLVCRFTLDTEIYHVELPQKVLSVLQAEPLETDPRFYYGMSIVFNRAVYQTREFFQYPLEKTPPPPPRRRGRATEQHHAGPAVYCGKSGGAHRKEGDGKSDGRRQEGTGAGVPHPAHGSGRAVIHRGCKGDPAGSEEERRRGDGGTGRPSAPARGGKIGLAAGNRIRGEA